MKRLAFVLAICACGRPAAPGEPTPPVAAVPPDPDQTPLPVPEPVLLTAAEVPAAPHTALTCSAPPAASAVHHPGFCTAVTTFLQEPLLGHVLRTTNSWLSGRLTDITAEDWLAFDRAGISGYDLATEHRVFDAQGRLFESVKGIFTLELPASQSDSAARMVTVYDRDQAGALATSVTRNRVKDASSAATPERLAETDRYFVDARGTVFISERIAGPGQMYSQPPASFTVYPSGMVKTAAITTTTWALRGRTNTEVTTYDESGLVVEDDVTLVVGGQSPLSTATLYSYVAGRLDRAVTTASGNLVSTTSYAYDGAGNNVSRSTTDSKGALISTWTGVYDAAGNLACEQTTDASGGALNNVVQYDYGCF